MPVTPSFADGVSGNSIKMLINGAPVFGLQNFNWKVSKDKKPVHGAGFKEAHGAVRSHHKMYELDFEITEMLVSFVELKAILAAGALAGGEVYEDPTDIRNALIVLAYPGANIAMSKTFSGVDITEASGGFSDAEDAEAINIKCSGFATGMQGGF